MCCNLEFVSQRGDHLLLSGDLLRGFFDYCLSLCGRAVGGTAALLLWVVVGVSFCMLSLSFIKK